MLRDKIINWKGISENKMPIPISIFQNASLARMSVSFSKMPHHLQWTNSN
jgi:hypothetical protein